MKVEIKNESREPAIEVWLERNDAGNIVLRGKRHGHAGSFGILSIKEDGIEVHKFVSSLGLPTRGRDGMVILYDSDGNILN